MTDRLPPDLWNEKKWNYDALIRLQFQLGIGYARLKEAQQTQIAEREEAERLNREFAGLKRASARELLAAVPPVSTSEHTLDIPAVDGSWVNERIDAIVDLEARLAIMREEVADHLRLNRAYVRGRDPEFIRSDATVLLAGRYLLHYGRAKYWSHAYRQITGGAFGWTPPAALMWSADKAKELP